MLNQSLEEIITASHYLEKYNYNRGSSGNISMRIADEWWITPSGATASDLTIDNLVQMNMHGEAISPGLPSCEWRFHRDIYLFRSEINFIIHTHSPAASAFSCLRQDLPAFHYMIALAGGDNVRCSDYQIFGSEQLSDEVVTAIEGRMACLLANHGLVAVGKNKKEALKITIEIENLCEQYLRLLSLEQKQIKLLSSEEMFYVIEKFKNYGVSHHVK